MGNRTKEKFASANAALRSGCYAKAERLYSELLDSSSPLFPQVAFNLGLARKRATSTLANLPQPGSVFRRDQDPSSEVPPFFDEEWYLAHHQLPRSEIQNALDHYFSQEHPFRLDPSPAFSNSQYQFYNPDVAQAKVNPLQHYLQSGQEEGRKLFGPARRRVVKTSSIPDGCDALIFVAFCPTGFLTDLQRHMLGVYKSNGFFVVLMVNTGDFNQYAYDHQYESGDIAIVRENVGFDMAAWVEAIQSIGGLSTRPRSLSFTNDSVIPIGRNALEIRSMLHEYSTGVVFLTRNQEIKSHEQSYFFTINADALSAGAIGVLEKFPESRTKEEAIYAVEIHLGDGFRSLGLGVTVVFEVESIRNPTIHRWQELLDMGFPFFKIQMLTTGIESLKSVNVVNALGDGLVDACQSHLAERSACVGTRVAAISELPVPAIGGCEVFGPIGQLQAYNYPPGQNPAVHVPALEDFGQELAPVDTEGVFAVIHCFYPDVAEMILCQLKKIGFNGFVLCTTDSEDKVRIVKGVLRQQSYRSECVLVPNRGRDVAPFLIEGRKYVDQYEYILHLHTKKSPHDSIYADWGSFLFRNLIGSADSVRTILKILQLGHIGLVYSKHFWAVEGLRNWGFDYEKARSILSQLNISLSLDMILEFPTSTMFWARTDALKPLFRLNLDYSDFDAEEGQIDGTLAHAIERVLLYVCEHTGFDHQAVTARRDSDADQLLKIGRVDELFRVQDAKPRLLSSFGKLSSVYKRNGETYPVHFKKSRSCRPRFNLLIPTVEPEKIYGGVSSAVEVALSVYRELPAETDFRIIITSDTISREGLREVVLRTGLDVLLIEPHTEINGPAIVNTGVMRGCPLALRARDMFFATAWWTADLGFRAQAAQQEMFGTAAKMAYLIQDYEPGFYPWSFQSAMARATYTKPDKTLAIFNSEELAEFIVNRYSFADCWCKPYSINAAIESSLRKVEKENIILVYGRPSVSRNLFDLIVEGLRIWQATDPSMASSYQVVFVGEPFEVSLLGELINASVLGKLSLLAYADLLNRAAIGISLMESPHPSYPPLEMASAGCLTITSRYESKDLSRRSENIVSLDSLTSECLSAAIASSISAVRGNRQSVHSEVDGISVPVAEMNATIVANRLMSSRG